MSEPLYTYVKGKGWQLFAGHIVNDWCHFRVTVEQREPGPGERWLSSKLEFPDFVRLLERQYNWTYIRARSNGGRDLGEIVLKAAPASTASNVFVYTIKFERIVDDGYREA